MRIWKSILNQYLCQIKMAVLAIPLDWKPKFSQLSLKSFVSKRQGRMNEKSKNQYSRCTDHDDDDDDDDDDDWTQRLPLSDFRLSPAIKLSNVIQRFCALTIN